MVLPEDDFIKKLTIKYVEYFLDGYQEKYGTRIHEVEYDGGVCEAEIEDDGVDIYRSVVGYELSRRPHGSLSSMTRSNRTAGSGTVATKVFETSSDNDAIRKKQVIMHLRMRAVS